MNLKDFNCVLCNVAMEESLPHLFLECPFAIRCWDLINVQTSQNSGPFQNLQNFRDQLGLRSAFFFHENHYYYGMNHLEIQKLTNKHKHPLSIAELQSRAPVVVNSKKKLLPRH